MWQQRSNARGLIRCHRELSSHYRSLARTQASMGPQANQAAAKATPSLLHSSTYFLVAFFGERFGEGFNGKEFIYKEPR